MKVVLSLVAGFLMVSSAHANMQCKTSEGVDFSIVEDFNLVKECDTNVLVIAGQNIATSDTDGCSDLNSFRGEKGTKLALANNGLGTLLFSGKIVNVNCDRSK